MGKQYECRPINVSGRRETFDSRWQDAVYNCIGAGRRYDEGFDAYVAGRGRVHMVGRAPARLAFSKCMTLDWGLELKDE